MHEASIDLKVVIKDIIVVTILFIKLYRTLEENKTIALNLCEV